jgi:GH24 family phage-related lysozyme (muramidase)
MSEITENRQRAFVALFYKASTDKYEKQDYELDTLIRKCLGLPVRPDKTLPYVGWLKLGTPNKATKHELSQDGIDAIKLWEGCSLAAYKCSAGVPTIGYGHTKTAKMGMTITMQQAEELLKQDIKDYVTAVNMLIKIPITQNQFDALVSFCFNVGISAFKHSTLLRLINENNLSGAALAFGNWVHAGGKRITGLVRRREFEREMFLRND